VEGGIRGGALAEESRLACSSRGESVVARESAARGELARTTL